MTDEKHKRTTDELQSLIQSVRDGTFHYEGRQKRSTDWARYDEAQVREISGTLSLIRRLVDIAARTVLQERQKAPGRPPCPPDDVAKALLLQSYFGVSNRMASGLVELFAEKLGISKSFSYKTIERGYDPSDITKILDRVFELTARLGNANEDTFSFDGTGDRVSSKENYEAVRSDQRKECDTPDWTGLPPRHAFQLAVIASGVHTKMIAGFASTGDRSMGELSMFSDVLYQTRINCPQMRTALGDALYSTRNACMLVSQYGSRPYFMPRRNSTLKPAGVPSWKSMLFEFVDDPQSWLHVYHMRSISESINSVDKRKFPWKLRKKLAWRRAAESFLRRQIYNIRQYHNLSYLQPSMIEKLPQ
jgi:transposase